MSIFDQSNVITTRNILTPFNPMMKDFKVKPSLITSALSQLTDMSISNPQDNQAEASLFNAVSQTYPLKSALKFYIKFLYIEII